MEQRPVVIISNCDYNKGEDVICCMITSQIKESRFVVHITNNDVDGGRLIHESIVKPGRLLVIEKSQIIKKFGTLSETKSKEVIDKVKELIELRRKPGATVQLSLP